MPARGPLLLGGLWAAAAALAVGVGLVAVDLVAGTVGEDVASPLSDDAVRGALGSASPSALPSARPTRATPAPSRTPGPQADGPLRTLTTRGGVVSARCHVEEPRLVYATPAEGYRTERSDDDVVRFVSSSRRVTVTLDCDGRELLTRTSTDSLGPTPRPATRSPQPTPSESDDDDSPDASDSPEPRESDDDSSGPG